jgi:DNA polymerase-1
VLPGRVNRATGRIHTSFNQTGAATGRLSSNDPNLQNIPIRTELGRQVRTAFVAPLGTSLLSADYSQVELRVLAHLSQDPGLIAAFRADEDIHNATASTVFGVPVEELTRDHRRVAKVVNFGIVYGLSPFGLQRAIPGMSREDAAGFIDTYFGKYPGIKAYIDQTLQTGRERGYVETLLGRRRYVPELLASNRQLRDAAERYTINHPVQGSAADVIKVAMIRLQAEFEKRALCSRMILQVHDELLFEVVDAELDEVRRLVQQEMSNSIPLAVPLKVETKVGTNWGQLLTIEEDAEELLALEA